MFVATVAVDLYRPGMHNAQRVVVHVGLSDEDALFAYNKDSYKIANTIRQLTPYQFIVREVQFSAEDREKLIAMTEEDDDFFVLTCEECGSTTCSGHAYSEDEPHHPYSY